MRASLLTLKAAVQPDGVVKLLQPLELDEPAEAVVTALIPSREPNAETVAALLEPVENLPQLANAAGLLDELGK